MENYLNILSPKYWEAVITFRTTNPRPSVNIVRWQGIQLVKSVCTLCDNKNWRHECDTLQSIKKKISCACIIS